MTHIIDQASCIQCGACEAECPEGAISVQADGSYMIDAAKCEDCAKCVDVCPTGSITKA